MSNQQAWFEYTTAKGQISATPIHWKGWLSLLSVVTGPSAIILFSIPWLRTTAVPPLLVVVVVLAIVFGGSFALIRFKGRRAEV
jgi:hypothetical protein